LDAFVDSTGILRTYVCSIVISAPFCVLPRLVSPVTVSGVTLLALMDGAASGGRPELQNSVFSGWWWLVKACTCSG
jgi:hypothetical protein